MYIITNFFFFKRKPQLFIYQTQYIYSIINDSQDTDIIMQEDNSSVSGENVHIDDYDDYDAMNDQNEIDNYSIIGQNISKLKRVLGWFGFSNSDNFYEIGDWSIDDHVELYNLDGDGNVSNNEGEDVVRIMKREKMKKLRRILMKLIGLIAVGFLFFYIVANLVIVNKEYIQKTISHKHFIYQLDKDSQFK